MRKRRAGRYWSTIVAVIVLCMVLSAVGFASDKVISVGIGANIKQLNPAFVSDWRDQIILYNVNETLVTFEEGTLKLIPSLATAWEIAPDGLTYTFWLRDDVLWHKGYGQFTAQDVKDTIEYHLDPETGSFYALYLEGIESVEVVNDFEVVFHLSQPMPDLLTAVLPWRPGFIIKPDVIKEYGDNYSEHIVGTGPFEFVEWVRDDHFTLQAFADYREAGVPKIDKLILKPILDDNTRLLALQNGDIDWMFFYDPFLYQIAAGNPTIVAQTWDNPSFWSITIRCDEGHPTSDVRVRQAIAYALDADAITRAHGGTQNSAEPYGSLIPPIWWEIADPFIDRMEGLTDYSRDVNKAKALLAEAGYADGLKLNYLMPNDWGGFTTTADLIIEQLAEVGITISAQSGGWGMVGEAYKTGSDDWDLGANGPDRLSPQMLFASMYGKSPKNYSRYQSDEYDALYELAAVTTDPEERWGIYHEMDKLLSQDMPNFTYFWGKWHFAWNPRITNYLPGYQRFNAKYVDVLSD